MLRRRTFASSLLAAPAVWPLRDALAQTPRDTLVMAAQLDDIISLDPHESFEFKGNETTTNIYEKLLTTLNEAPDKIVGELAESWEASPDGLTHTFRLKAGRKFASGNPITAQDAEYSLRRAVTMNKTPAFILTQFGLNGQNATEKIRATDDRTIAITIAEPVSPSFFHYCLSANVGAIVDRKVVEANKQGDDWGNGWLKTHSAGSGPYVLRTWRASETVTLEANPNYAGQVRNRRVVTRHVAEPSNQLLLLQRGDVDIARNLGPDQLRTLASDKGFKIQRAQKAANMYICMNQRHPELAKPQVREALKWAVDYEAIQRNIVSTTYDVHQSILPTGFLGAIDDKPYRFDPAKAKALLAEAGVPNGFSVTFDYSPVQPWGDIAQAVQATFGQIGVKLNLLPGEMRQVITRMRARQHEMLMLYWSPDYMDPHSNAEAFTLNPDNGDNPRAKTLAWRNSWSVPEFNERIAAAVRERDSAKRAELYRSLQRDHLRTSPFIIMLQAIETAAMRANVSGLDIGPINDRIYYADTTKT
ncbi:ABC transporter substrate-binding protein [Vineibacter terrae]|uniref:ABC transporter substrate-binding protein n=1 Tax=Vineibacter terrae TaxID=2586908 RepID=A0A5C8PRN5_9HYPH|nr:ABC transporter substrate-binding protein [Vineibacter terrae]TXL78844.1 ABC transporter substrate-binding protein [Vineibacter terrae]